MKIVVQNNDVLTISISEKVDSSNASEFEKKVNEVFSDNVNKILFNLSGLEYISSAGLRIFLMTAKQIKAKNGKFAMFGLGDMVMEVFKVSGLLEIFPIFKNEEEALKFLS